MSFSFDIKGIEGLQQKLQQYPDKVKAAVRPVLAEHVTKINAEQKRLAQGSIDRGQLIQGIAWVPEGELNFLLFSQAPYSAYIEFGTRKKFRAIPGVDAGEYRGGGGSTGKLYDAILAWVKRKGIGAALTKSGRPSKSKKSDAAQRQAAFLIARSILINGINPQPFFFTPFLSKREQIKRDVQQAIDNVK